ncbi:tubulin glycylase 3A-like isoform X1 [Onthophagus taurus]|uniref:tubulin glycylase 3A-like isoform X1 n=1 Tax=Onthophagus taurus TaxID=166361 RepID=UPI0039BDF865
MMDEKCDKCQKSQSNAYHNVSMDNNSDVGQTTKQSPKLLSPRKSTHIVAPTPQQLVDNICPKYVEPNKYKINISSERLAQLKKLVDEAVNDHRIFTIKGGWQILRGALHRRGWIEKYETAPKKPGIQPQLPQNLDDLCVNLPSRQAWESQKVHMEKCERTVMSRLLQVHDCDLYWNMRKDQSDWQHRCNHNKLMNRFGRSLFTSKEGLTLLLQQLYWHIEPGVAQVNYPRCYVLGFPDHFHNFVDDFRLTACMGLLKWFVHKADTEDEYSIKSPEGKVPISCVNFAMSRVDEFVATKKHLDIDRDFPKVWDHEWEQFLTNFHRTVNQGELFLESKEWSLHILHAAAKVSLQEVARYWPQFNLDGMKNIWIMKPGNKCRGRGIHLVRNVQDVSKAVNLKLKYVVQKYIEKPLIIYKTKFDIRQWFLITSVQPLTIWMYRECYFRFSSQIFSLENFHESLHLTNHAVQCKYANVNQRDKALPDENMWDCESFKSYLKQIGHGNKWEDVIFPGMRQSLIATMLACQETMDRRPNTFELYGADFILAEDFSPWLLEINSSPDLSHSTSVTSRMCPHCLEDLVKVIVDKRRDPKADTGRFILIYKQNLPRPPAYLGMSLTVRGKRIFKNRLRRHKNSGKENESISKRNGYALKAPTTPQIPTIVHASYTPRETVTSYSGPVIGDLMEELQSTYLKSCEDGIDFVPVLKNEVGSKIKKKTSNNKEGVSKGTKIVSKSGTNKKRSVNRKPKGSAKRDGDTNLTTTSAKSTTTIQRSSTGQGRNYVKGGTTASILNGHNILSKFRINNKEINKNNNGCLEKFYGDIDKRHVSAKADLLTVGVNFKNYQKNNSK